MQATPERVREGSGRTVQVWHLLADGQDCNGDCDWHPISCSDEEGIVAPGGTRDVPLDLDERGQRWCGDCLVLARVGK
ncbi:hypothetical protein [Streptomyces aureocirculatus]|uniref:hypothetical protein n=1 Tax=Streptomyces aureocirculatus TaxID=67275 RepID=UPI0004C4FC1A|nr:hypothetical protein [Streptomyces aureocirculatus]